MTNTKITKKVYNKSRKLFLQELETVESILELAKETDGMNFPDIDMWNDYHDREEFIQNAILDLDSKWETRNWTAGDWNSYFLITHNVDQIRNLK